MRMWKYQLYSKGRLKKKKNQYVTIKKENLKYVKKINKPYYQDLKNNFILKNLSVSFKLKTCYYLIINKYEHSNFVGLKNYTLFEIIWTFFVLLNYSFRYNTTKSFFFVFVFLQLHI